MWLIEFVNFDNGCDKKSIDKCSLYYRRNGDYTIDEAQVTIKSRSSVTSEENCHL